MSEDQVIENRVTEDRVTEDQVIELDTSWNELDDPVPPPPRRADRWRTVVASALAVLCLASLTSGRRPPPPVFQLLGTFDQPATRISENPGDLFFMGGMLVTQRSGSLVALEFDGRQRWSVRLEGSDQDGFLNTRNWHGLVLVEHYIPSPEPTPVEPRFVLGHTIALDPRTGQQLWRMPGFLEPAGDVVFLHDGDNPVRVYDSLPSGLLWTVPPSRASAVDADSHALVTVTDAGVLTEFDLKTGAVRASSTVRVPRVDPPIASPADGSSGYPAELGIEVFPEWITLRSRFYQESGYPVTQTLSYDRKTLRPLASPVDGFDFTQSCGPVLCAYIGSRASIVDRRHLTTLWNAPEDTYPYWTGSALVLLDQSALEAHRVVDPRTGATLLDLNGWTPVSAGDNSAMPAMRMFTRYARPTSYVALLEGSTLRSLGPLPFPVVHCLAEDMVLGCATSDGRTTVWRINAS